MSRTIQSTQQMKGSQIPQTKRKDAQSGKSLPSKDMMKMSGKGGKSKTSMPGRGGKRGK